MMAIGGTIICAEKWSKIAIFILDIIYKIFCKIYPTSSTRSIMKAIETRPDRILEIDNINSNPFTEWKKDFLAFYNNFKEIDGDNKYNILTTGYMVNLRKVDIQNEYLTADQMKYVLENNESFILSCVVHVDDCSEPYVYFYTREVNEYDICIAVCDYKKFRLNMDSTFCKCSILTISDEMGIPDKWAVYCELPDQKYVKIQDN